MQQGRKGVRGEPRRLFTFPLQRQAPAFLGRVIRGRWAVTLVPGEMEDVGTDVQSLHHTREVDLGLEIQSDARQLTHGRVEKASLERGVDGRVARRIGTGGEEATRPG